MDNHLRLIPDRGHSRRLPQLFLVGHRIHVLLRRGYTNCDHYGIGAYISRSGEYSKTSVRYSLAKIFQIAAYLAAGLTFNSSCVHALVYSSDGAKEAAAAGFILLSMVTVSLSQTQRRARTLTLSRSCGYSTSARNRPPAPIASLISLLSTKEDIRREAPDQCPTTTAPAQRRLSHRPRRCTLQHS